MSTAGEPTDRTDPIEQLGYERARDELAEVVRALEVGGLSLDDALALWERGERLARRCEQQLAGAKDRVDAVLRAEQVTGGGAAEQSASAGGSANSR